jgi:hypothetical protein
MMTEWGDASEGPNSLRDTWIGGLHVIVSDDDEGPQRPAYYWLIEDDDGRKVEDGWTGSPEQSEREAVKAAEAYRDAAIRDTPREQRRFAFVVNIDCETLEQAQQVMAERLGHDEDYGFKYRLHEWRYDDDMPIG